MFALRPYQQAAIDAVYNFLRCNESNPCIVLPTGCHAKDHPILLYNGTLKPVQDIVVGDLIMAPDSKPRRVLSLCRGRDDMYRIKPIHGTPFVVNGDHVLSLVCTREGKSHPCNKQGGEIENISVTEYLRKSKYWKHLRKLYHVPVDFATQTNLPIPPYILGLLLGDGCFRDTVELTTADEEIEKAWCHYVHLLGYEVAVRDGAGKRCPTYRIVGPKGQENFLKRIFEVMRLDGQLSSTKFIPGYYLTASRQERFLLLAGVMDADGHLGNGSFDYVTKSRELATDVTFLARSLGFRVHECMKYGLCQNGTDGWFYRLSISGDTSTIPCLLKRKQAPKRLQKKNVLRTGFSIEPAGQDDYYGFTLDEDHLYVDGYFMVHHNSGKTPVLASICRDAVSKWNGRVLVISHVKELLQQAAEKLQTICPDVPVGVYSAGLKSRETTAPVIVAGIQSVYRKACELDRFDLIIIDEAHLLAPDGEGMYQTFFKDTKIINPRVRLIGLTATPYRLKSGMLCGPKNLLNEICYEIGITELIEQGYLCPLKSKSGRHKVDCSDLHLRAGEFVASEVDALMNTADNVDAACREIISMTRNRNSVLIFGASVEHATRIKETIERFREQECGIVTGDTSAEERDRTLRRFKGETFSTDLFGTASPHLKYLVNVNVLTTGFDAPNIDCIVLLRPTASPGLYSQMVGRGFRLHESKTDCLVLDYGGNIIRHGPVDAIKIEERKKGKGKPPVKECPQCLALLHAAISACPDCGYEFPPPERDSHGERASNEGILTGEIVDTEYDVEDVSYRVHTKRGATDDDPKTLRVDYRVGFAEYQSEWVCPEHSGWIRKKFEKWWTERSHDPIPDTAELAARIGRSGGIATAEAITVRKFGGERYGRIVKYSLGEKPHSVSENFDSQEDEVYLDDDVPF